jgi:hypothetical protein
MRRPDMIRDADDFGLDFIDLLDGKLRGDGDGSQDIGKIVQLSHRCGDAVEGSCVSLMSAPNERCRPKRSWRRGTGRAFTSGRGRLGCACRGFPSMQQAVGGRYCTLIVRIMAAAICEQQQGRSFMTKLLAAPENP